LNPEQIKAIICARRHFRVYGSHVCKEAAARKREDAGGKGDDLCQEAF
jgi:hypothetical protein